MKDSWWSRKAEYLQWLSDTKQLGTFYAEVRKLVGPMHRSSVPLKSRSGEQRLTAKEDVLKRWAEHFKELLNKGRVADIGFISNILPPPQVSESEEPPTMQEIVNAIQVQPNNRAVGVDSIPEKATTTTQGNKDKAEVASTLCGGFQDFNSKKAIVEDLKIKNLEEEINFKRELCQLQLETVRKELEIKIEVCNQLKGHNFNIQNVYGIPKNGSANT
ncbi:unnamed protein product [Parnassius apollo]|uniref:(apollo) hypothetical protein n=1 Tax=Parnassius apollo TaxID=110799 RepID=A0A8S3WTP3_PARAO|nr:unnamed protein product [Parnassius apollo]